MDAETQVKENEMTFRGYYDSLPPSERKSPKKEFVTEIAVLCKCAESTVRAWLSGAQQPDPLKKVLLPIFWQNRKKNYFQKSNL